jgi:hypothetical protein
MTLERLTARRPRRRVPEPDPLVVRARRDQLTVRREGDGVDRAQMALERLTARRPQSLIVLSREPDATSLPSGEKATELTEFKCPLSGSPRGAPVAASQSLTVSSYEPDATSLPSGEKATERKISHQSLQELQANEESASSTQ